MTDAEKIREWLDGGCNSWGTPVEQIERVLAERDDAIESWRSVLGSEAKLRQRFVRMRKVVESMANFDGRCNNAALKQIARAALAKEPK
jgi:ribosomal protein L20A (L18A)